MPDFPIRVKVDSSDAVRGSRKVKKELQGVENRADSMRKGIARAFTIFASAAVVGAGINTLRNFSQEMSTVRAITKATETEFQALRDTAKELGATTRFSATQAAEGMSFLARAGFDTAQVMASVDDTLLLAQAGALELGRAADIASNILTGFRIEADDAGRVVDVLAFAANNANTTVSQLGEAMKFVAPVASGLGVSLETATASAAALSDAGLQASLAGTGLRRILSELESPAGKTQQILKSLGLTTDDVRVSQVGLVTAIERLKQAGVDTGLALEIFGDRGGPAFEVLSTSIPKVKQMEEALLKSGGTAKDMAAIMDDNLNGALLAVKSAFEALLISFGDLGAESFLTEFFRTLASAVRSLAENIEPLIKAFGVLAITIGVILAKQAIPAAITGIKSLTAAMAANPIGLLLVALTAVISTLVLFSDRIKLSTDGIIKLRDYAVAAWQIMLEKLMPLLIAIKEGFTNSIKVVQDLLQGLGLTFGDVLNLLKTFINTQIGLFVGMGQAIAVVFRRMKDTIVSFFSSGDIPSSANQFGTDVRDAFLEGFGRDFVGEFVNLLDPAFGEVGARARQLAEERMAAQRQQQAQTAGAGVPTAALPPVPTQVGGVGESRQAVRDAIADLDEMAGLLRLTNAEREIQNGLIEIQNDLEKSNITLSESEKQIIEERLRGLQSLQAQADIMEDLNSRVNEFQTTQAALNQLYAQGRISLDEYNEALKNTQLGMDLDNLQTILLDADTAITESLREQLEERQQIIQEALDTRLISEQEALALSIEANKQYNDAIMQNELARQKMQMNAGATTFGALADLAADFGGKQSKTYRALFAVSKAFAIAESTIAIVQGIAKSASLGWPANIAAIAATIAQTAGLVSQIKSVAFAGGFQTGGSFKVQGQGGADSQLVAFKATPGEQVNVQTPAQQAAAAAPAGSPGVNLTNVNVVDPAIVEDFLTSPEGETVLVNSIGQNRESINATLQQ